MATTIYEKALVTSIGNLEERRDILIPYEGYLTDAKLGELANKTYRKLGELGIPSSIPLLKRRLTNEWYTGREKNVSVEDCGAHVNVRGQGWMWIGHSKESVIVV